MFSIFLETYLKAELLDHMVTFCSTFWEPRHCFSKWLHYFTFPSAAYESASFSTATSTLVVVCLFHRSHPHVCKVVSHYNSGLHFPNCFLSCLPVIRVSPSSFLYFWFENCHLLWNKYPTDRKFVGFRAWQPWLCILPLFLPAVTLSKLGNPLDLERGLQY